jgi:axial budding pattern protein 2
MTSQNISVSATDVYGNSANTTILLQITSTLFTRTIGNVNATIGHDFSYSFSRSLFTDSSVQVSVDLGNAFSWLGYDPSTMRLQGHVPSNTNPQQVLLNVIASEGPMSDDQTLTIIVSDDDGQMAPQTSSSSAAVVGATSSPSSKSVPQPQPTAIGFVNGGD